MAGISSFTKNIFLTILFSFVIFSFIFGFLIETNPGSPIFNGSQFEAINQSYTSLNAQLSNFNNLSNTIYSDSGQSQPDKLDYVFLIFKGAFYIPLTMIQFAYEGIKSIGGLLMPTLGGTGLGVILSLVITFITAVLVTTLVILFIKVVRTGEGER